MSLLKIEPEILDSTANFAFGNVNGGNLVSANYISANGSLLTNLTGANVAGQVGNALVAGTVYTNAQPNITSLGTLSNLTVSGNTNLGAVGNLIITGGNANYVLSTNGTGNLSWVEQSAGGGGGASVTVDSVPPVEPTEGNMWLDNNTGDLSVYVGNGWATINSSGIKYTAATTPPVSGNSVGDQWYNTTSGVLYEYMNDGTTNYWVDIISPTMSSSVTTGYVTRNYTANGSSAVFTVSEGCAVNNVLVFLNGICQTPTTDYTITGTTLTTDVAPESGTSVQIRELPR